MAIKQNLWLLALFALPIPVAAQEQKPDTVLVRILAESVRARAHVRITGRSSVEGRITDASGPDVRLVGARLPVNEIEKVERRTKAGGGALEGGIVGGIAGATGALYILGGAMAGSDISLLELVPVAALGAAIGGLFGVLVGTAADSPEETWEILWTRTR